MKNNKVAFVIHGLPMGGAEKFLISIINEFKKLGGEPLLILLSDETALVKELDNDVNTVKLIKKHRFDVSISKKIKYEIVSRNIKKIFCVNTYAYFLTKLSFSKNDNVLFFLSPHTTKPFSFYNYLQNIVYTKFVGSKDQIIYLCKNQKIYYEIKYNINKNNGLIIYNGIDTQKYNPENYELNKNKLIIKELGIGMNEKVIIIVARVEKEKNHQSAIESLALLHRKWGKNYHLLIVGGGSNSYINKLKAVASENKIINYVHFIGNSNDVRKYYSIADAFTLTSSSETFSLAALEAMSFGLPCALTDVGGANEMIDENINGKLMRVNDIESISNAWHHVLNNSYSKKNIRNYVINNFDSKKMLDTYIDILN
jgi:glycosyltransferase involved in cell wall biosynthesis